MNKVSYISSSFIKNECFIENNKYNRDNFLFFIINLKSQFKKINFDISTSDINLPEYSNIILQAGLDIDPLKNIPKEKYYLLMLESPHIDKGLMDNTNHKYFRKIFTWNDDMVDDFKYFKVNYAFDIPKSIPKKIDNKKLCCVVAGNKNANHFDELYTKRVEFIRWFEKHHPNEFDLYGTKWDQYRYGHGFFGKVINKIKFLRKKNHFPSYKGMVESKFETMKNYKFSICYENIRDQSGYITEKRFDSFFAGCVPIYWGAKNITDHIPADCFIDKREFSSLDDIYLYIKNMSEFKYMEYLDSIERFLDSSQADPFRADVFAETIINVIKRDINTSS